AGITDAYRAAGAVMTESPSPLSFPDMQSAGSSSRCSAVRRPRGLTPRSRKGAREHRRLMQKGIVINLLDKEIRDVGARDEPARPGAWIAQRAIGVSLRPIGQDHGTHDHPVKLAPTDDPFLHVLVGIDAPQ